MAASNIKNSQNMLNIIDSLVKNECVRPLLGWPYQVWRIFRVSISQNCNNILRTRYLTLAMAASNIKNSQNMLNIIDSLVQNECVRPPLGCQYQFWRLFRVSMSQNCNHFLRTRYLTLAMAASNINNSQNMLNITDSLVQNECVRPLLEWPYQVWRLFRVSISQNCNHILRTRYPTLAMAASNIKNS